MVDWRLFKPVFGGFPRKISRFRPEILKERKILHKSYIFYVKHIPERRERRDAGRAPKGYLSVLAGS